MLSVYDKTGSAELASGLSGLGWEVLASAGTARFLREAGAEIRDLAEYTGAPPVLGHRVVTLHPKVHGGILADREDPSHRAEMAEGGFEPIDLVAVNLYPFFSRPGVENIDVGGCALLRAAAKNHAHVTALSDPADYQPVLDEMRSRGSASAETRLRLARAAFARTAAYDAAIADWFARPAPAAAPAQSPPEPLPSVVRLELQRAEFLRYGENPDQPAARYRRPGDDDWWANVVLRNGPPLSYLNLLDAAAGWELVNGLGEGPAAAVVKHADPCGVAVAPWLDQALRLAYECDRRAAFGGVVAVNRSVDADTAAVLERSPQADVVIAPGFGEGTAERIAARRSNTRVLQAPPPPPPPGLSFRQIPGGWLAQGAPPADRPGEWRVATRRRPSPAEMEDVRLAWRVCAAASSNAAVLAAGGAAWGIGAGQPDRVGAVRMAAAKAEGRAAGGACASDGFFPFPDGVEEAAAAGAAVVAQPGGSVNDQAVIDRADQLGLAMLFTGRRRFRH